MDEHSDKCMKVGYKKRCRSCYRTYIRDSKRREREKKKKKKAIKKSKYDYVTCEQCKNKPYKEFCKKCLLLYRAASCRNYRLRKKSLNKIKKTELINHSKTHIGEKLYQCNHCVKNFLWKSSLIYHLRSHTGEKSTKNTIMKSKYDDVTCQNCKNKPFKEFCKKCILAYRAASSKNYRHRKKMMKGINKTKLTNHAKRLTVDKPFQFKQCDNAFLGKGYLIYHLKSHTGEKPYKCCKDVDEMKSSLNISYMVADSDNEKKSLSKPTYKVSDIANEYNDTSQTTTVKQEENECVISNTKPEINHHAHFSQQDQYKSHQEINKGFDGIKIEAIEIDDNIDKYLSENKVNNTVDIQERVKTQALLQTVTGRSLLKNSLIDLDIPSKRAFPKTEVNYQCMDTSQTTTVEQEEKEWMTKFSDAIKIEDIEINDGVDKYLSKNEVNNVYIEERVKIHTLLQTETGRNHVKNSLIDSDFQSKRVFPKTEVNYLDCKTSSKQGDIKTYSHKSNLNKHVINHTEKLKFSCSKCEKVFSDQGRLKNHMIIHFGDIANEIESVSNIGVKPYQCTHCDKDFLRKGSLIYHMRSHTGEKSTKNTIMKSKYDDVTCQNCKNRPFKDFCKNYSCTSC